MSRIGTAFSAFFKSLFDGQTAERVAAALQPQALLKSNVSATPAVQAPKEPAKPARSEALTLLSALQREARLIDLIQEPLSSYSDQQIGAAARNVLKDSSAVLQRFFELRPAVSQSEGETISLPADYDSGRYHLTGNVTGNGATQGKLVHPGWEATTINLPTWNGQQASAKVIAAAEVEIP